MAHPFFCILAMLPLFCCVLSGRSSEAHASDVATVWTGGAGTTFLRGDGAFSAPAPFVTGSALELFFRGKSVFERDFPVPLGYGRGASGWGVRAEGGYNQLSCRACHTNGKGATDEDDLLEHGFSASLIEGRKPIHRMTVVGDRTFVARAYRVRLQAGAVARYSVFSDLHGEVPVDVRRPTPLFGLGLIERISDADILANADPNDADGDGVSGRPHFLDEGHELLGKFGWKAESASLHQQTVTALHNEMGRTLRGGGCDQINDLCANDISAGDLKDLVVYVQGIGVPASYQGASAKRGRRIFTDIGCDGCHVETLGVRMPGGVEEDIVPYSDFLLHDIGSSGELVQSKDDLTREWRTPPLWGVGIFISSDSFNGLMHDGSARSFEDAIGMHGGEAHRARRNFQNLSKANKQDLLRFLDSL